MPRLTVQLIRRGERARRTVSAEGGLGLFGLVLHLVILQIYIHPFDAACQLLPERSPATSVSQEPIGSVDVQALQIIHIYTCILHRVHLVVLPDDRALCVVIDGRQSVTQRNRAILLRLDLETQLWRFGRLSNLARIYWH